MLERTQARARVNQAPSGTLVSADERKAASSAAKGRKTKSMRNGFRRHTSRATRATIQVVRKVTRITQTPYAFPRRVV